MSTAWIDDGDSVAHIVATSRLQACRRDERLALPAAVEAQVAETPAAEAAFADTVPLWFRSEAFAEDVEPAVQGAAGVQHGRHAPGMARIDTQMLTAGAAVLRLTLQALKLQRR